jgi:hypothetical protein
MKCDRRGAYMNRRSVMNIAELRPTLQCRVRTVCVGIELNCAMELQSVKIHLSSSLTTRCMLDRVLTRYHITDEQRQQPTWGTDSRTSTSIVIIHKVQRHKLAVTKFGTTQYQSIMSSTTRAPWSIISHSPSHVTSKHCHNLNPILSH